MESDHKPLESILKKSLLSAPKRLQRMMLRLQNFEFEVGYKQGPLFLADILSRASVSQSTDDKSQKDDVMSVEDTRSATENEFEETDMRHNLSKTQTILDRIQEETRADNTPQALTALIPAEEVMYRQHCIPIIHLEMNWSHKVVSCSKAND